MVYRLNFRFYTYILFSKDKYIVGNKYAHILTYGDFVHITPMSRIACRPPTVKCGDNSRTHKFNKAMENVSIGLDQ